MFKNREEAAKKLAKALSPFKNRDDIVIVALPRGGVPIAFYIAKELNAPLDIFFVKKIPSPFNKEAAIGAVSENGYYFVAPIANALGISQDYINSQIKAILEKIKQKRAIYNKDRIDIKNKTVIIADDGIATGSSMKLAIEALKKEGAKSVIAVAPVAPPEVASELKNIADNIYILSTPSNFNAVGQFYEDFHQLSDDEVISLLSESNKFSKSS